MHNCFRDFLCDEIQNAIVSTEYHSHGQCTTCTVTPATRSTCILDIILMTGTWAAIRAFRKQPVCLGGGVSVETFGNSCDQETSVY